MGPPAFKIHGPRRSCNNHGDSIGVGIIDCHGTVKQPNNVMNDRQHRLAKRLGISMGYANGGVLMKAGDDFGFYISPVIDQGVMQPPKRRARVDTGIFNIILFNYIDD